MISRRLSFGVTGDLSAVAPEEIEVHAFRARVSVLGVLLAPEWRIARCSGDGEGGVGGSIIDLSGGRGVYSVAAPRGLGVSDVRCGLAWQFKSSLAVRIGSLLADLGQVATEPPRLAAMVTFFSRKL